LQKLQGMQVNLEPFPKGKKNTQSFFYGVFRSTVKFVLKACAYPIQVKGDFPKNGGNIFAVNHPNSFLDAVMIGVFSKQKVYFFARGDAFAHPFFAGILQWMGALPVFRKKEGKDQLHRNHSSFEKAQELLQKGHNILIFSEGISTNDHQPKPLVNGTARLLQWVNFSNPNDPVAVVPFFLYYKEFRRSPLQVQIFIGSPFVTDKRVECNEHITTFWNKAFALSQVKKTEVKAARNESFPRKDFLLLKRALGFFGWLLHWPFSWLVYQLAEKTTRATVFFDSVYFGLHYFLLPIYWIGWWWFLPSPWEWSAAILPLLLHFRVYRTQP